MYPNCIFLIFNHLKVLVLSVESNIFIPMQSTNQGSIISVRTSDASFKTVSSGGWYTQSYTESHKQQRVLQSDPIHFSDWHATAFPVVSSNKTTSFVEMHTETSENMDAPFQSITPRQNSGPGGPAIGEDELGSPVGDMLFPMLVIALGYIVVKLFRNRKTSQAL